jgi:hypothetical protein
MGLSSHFLRHATLIPHPKPIDDVKTTAYIPHGRGEAMVEVAGMKSG